MDLTVAGGKDLRMLNSDPPRIVFIHPFNASFIEMDLALLRTFAEVVPVQFQGKSNYPLLFRAVAKCDVVLSWFALGYSAFANVVARLFGAKSIVVAGGWDVSGMPEIGYGRLLTEWGSLVARSALTTATCVLSISNWSERIIKQVAPTSRVRTAYLGVDTQKFRPGPKERIVVSVAQITHENLLRKGLKTFVEASARLPGLRFLLVGEHRDDSVQELRAISGDNISFPGRILDGQLVDLLARTTVYVQASYTEGFGVALAEAMSSGCVPVVTRAGAIPELVGESGIYVPYGSPAELSAGIERALDSGLGSSARRRIEQHYTLGHRLRELRDAVRQVCARGGWDP